ncbi:MAG: hypothetical protein R3E04_05430 [Sphingobium sp.]
MWKWIPVPKGLALAAFLLPWMTVSCSGQTIAKATGFGLAFGQISFLGQAAQRTNDTSINIWLILALIAIAGGLYLLLTKEKDKAKHVLGTTVAALVLIFMGTSRYSKSAAMSEASGDGSAYGLDKAALSMIEVSWQFGYWLATIALIVAAVMSWLVLAGKDDEAEAKLRAMTSNAADSMKSSQRPADTPSSDEDNGGKKD